MEILVYGHGERKITEGVPVERLPELLQDQSAVIWVDMDSPTEADEQVLLNVFNFHPLTVEDCRENRHYPKVEEFPGYIYFIVHGVTSDTSPDRFNTIELDGFLGSNYVITYHHASFRSIRNVKQLLRTSPVACQRGPAFLLHQILDQVVDYYSPVLDDFDDRIDQLEHEIFTLNRPNNAILAQIMDLKRSVLRLRRISTKQMDILLRMSRGEFELIPDEMRPFYRDVYDHLVRVVDLSESYRDLISGSLEAYLSVVSNRMNEIMKVLTIFSAIMLPLTFIAGVYGMNFDNMPELHSRYGYFGTLAVMGVVAVGMLIFFWRRGWLGRGDNETPEG
ncbi:MAG TPA: magnesium/cobalt transporter CorA [Pyrinomonadaceae bacterium]|jgi:magnesium transporter|nr:magnesium/cobalt transporter CorA [Pyrinomonadaceae bacterium]